MADPSGGMTFVQDPKKPIGGHVLAHASTVRLSLRKGKGEQRVAKLIDHPCMRTRRSVSCLRCQQSTSNCQPGHKAKQHKLDRFGSTTLMSHQPDTQLWLFNFKTIFRDEDLNESTWYLVLECQGSEQGSEQESQRLSAYFCRKLKGLARIERVYVPRGIRCTGSCSFQSLFHLYYPWATMLRM
jgi:hypothetical protein